MEPLLILVMLVVILDIASLHWGYDSREQFNSPEWMRRATWRVLTGSNPSWDETL